MKARVVVDLIYRSPGPTKCLERLLICGECAVQEAGDAGLDIVVADPSVQKSFYAGGKQSVVDSAALRVSDADTRNIDVGHGGYCFQEVGLPRLRVQMWNLRIHRQHCLHEIMMKKHIQARNRRPIGMVRGCD